MGLLHVQENQERCEAALSSSPRQPDRAEHPLAGCDEPFCWRSHVTSAARERSQRCGLVVGWANKKNGGVPVARMRTQKAARYRDFAAGSQIGAKDLNV